MPLWRGFSFVGPDAGIGILKTVKWYNDRPITIKLCQHHNGVLLQIPVHRFDLSEESLRVMNPSAREVYDHRYALRDCDFEEATQSVMQYIHQNGGTYVKENLRNADYLVREIFSLALTFGMV